MSIFYDKCEFVVQYAIRLADEVDNWADYSNALFDPVNGIVGELFKTPMAKYRFIKSKYHDRINHIRDKLQDRFGLAEGAQPSKDFKIPKY